MRTPSQVSIAIPGARLVPRLHSPILRAAAFLAVAAASAFAQSSGAKQRLELSDSAHRAATVTSAVRPTPVAAKPVAAPSAPAPTPAPPAAPASPATTAGLRIDFVRNQAIYGVALYAPAFATTVAQDGLAWGASYLLVAGGTYVAAAEISRELKITDPMQRLATGVPIRGAIAGSMLASTVNGDPRTTAASMLAGSIGGVALGLWLGQPMSDGEAAATLFGSDVLGLAGYASSTAMGMQNPGAPNKTRTAMTVGGMLIGAPLGQAYAALASYNVTPGDLTAMTATAGVGMLAGLTAVANGPRTDRQIAAALGIGGAVGLIAGDRLLVRRYDHTPEEGRMVVLGGMGGGLMGAGVALLTGGTSSRTSAFTAGMTTAGAAAGIALAQRYIAPKADGEARLGGLKLNPLGVVAAMTGTHGSYTIGSLRF